MAAKKLNKKTVDKKKPAPVKVAAKTAPAVRREPASGGAKAGVASTTTNQRLAAARAVANKINTEHKSAVIVTADEAHTNSFLRRPCGHMQLDIDTGGGLPAGRFSTITGPNQAGKTTLMFYYFGMHQRLYGNDSFLALLASEGGVDYFQARRCGWIIPIPWEVIEAENRELVRLGLPKFTVEQVADFRREIGHNILVQGLSTCEEYLDTAQRLLESNLYGIVGLDSYEGLMPQAEAGLETLEDFPQQAARASAIGRFLQHYGPITRNQQHFTTFIMTCQVRFNRKKAEAQSYIAKTMPDYMEAVPDSVKHWRKIGMMVANGEKMTEGTKEKRVTIGKYINYSFLKGTMNCHDNVRGDMPFYYESGFDLMGSLVTAGMKYGVIREREGQLTFLPNGEPDEYLDGVPGVDEFIRALKEDQDKEMQVRRAVLHAAKKPCVYV